MERLTTRGVKFLAPIVASKIELCDEIERHQKYYDKLCEYENTVLTPMEIEQLQQENAELKETIKNLNNNQTLKIDKFAILLNEMDIKSYEISILQEGLKILSKYNDEITYREIIILLRYGSIIFPNSCYDNDLKEEAE